jgi:hypothetical protein
VYSWQEADLSILSRKGGPEAHVQEPLGEASRTLWPALRFYQVLCRLATNHSVRSAIVIPHTESRIGVIFGIGNLLL